LVCLEGGGINEFGRPNMRHISTMSLAGRIWRTRLWRLLRSPSTSTPLMDRFSQGRPNCRLCAGRGRINLDFGHPDYVEGFGGPYLNSPPCPRCFPSSKTRARRVKTSLSEELAALSKLHDEGVLTDEEFELAKQKLLGSTSPKRRRGHSTKPKVNEEPPELPGETDRKFSIGDRVSHPIFGTGRVTSISGSGRKAEIEVNFHRKGRKVLSLAFAPLKKI